MLLILSFLKSNWKAIAIALIIAGIYFVGRDHGADSVQRNWDAVKLQQQVMLAKQEAEQKEKKLKADRQAIQTIKNLRNEVQTLSRKLAYALNDPVYRARPTADGLRSLNDSLKAAGHAATGS